MHPRSACAAHESAPFPLVDWNTPGPADPPAQNASHQNTDSDHIRQAQGNHGKRSLPLQDMLHLRSSDLNGKAQFLGKDGFVHAQPPHAAQSACG